jgi:hypothetical protein
MVLEPTALQIYATACYLRDGVWPSWETIALAVHEGLEVGYEDADEAVAQDARAGKLIPFLHEYDSGMKRWHLRVPTPALAHVATVLDKEA